MPEAPRIPFVRITRPYGSENEYVEGDFAWLGRTTLILPNGPSRAAGELIRFEVVLSNGAPVLRGEGNVVAHHPPGGARPPGLEVRFTRVDSKSKLVLDRVRERRATMSSTSMSMRSPDGSPSGASMLPGTGSLPPGGISLALGSGSLSPDPISASAGALPVLRIPTDTPSEQSGVRLTKAASHIAPPANRDEILERLRVRARGLAAAGGLSFKKR